MTTHQKIAQLFITGQQQLCLQLIKSQGLTLKDVGFVVDEVMEFLSLLEMEHVFHMRYKNTNVYGTKGSMLSLWTSETDFIRKIKISFIFRLSNMKLEFVSGVKSRTGNIDGFVSEVFVNTYCGNWKERLKINFSVANALDLKNLDDYDGSRAKLYSSDLEKHYTFMHKKLTAFMHYFKDYA